MDGRARPVGGVVAWASPTLGGRALLRTSDVRMLGVMRRLHGLRALVHDAVDAITSLVEDTQHASFERSVSLLSRTETLGDSARAVDGVRRAITRPIFASIRATNRGVESIG